MDVSLFISIAAFVLSIVSLAWTVFSYRNKKTADALAGNLAKIVDVEGKIGETPSLLRFHGIDNYEEALASHEVSAKELSYLVNSFTVGGMYYRLSHDKGNFFSEGSYRYIMISSAKTRKAWPLVRVFIAESPYRVEIDSLVDKLNKL